MQILVNWHERWKQMMVGNKGKHMAYEIVISKELETSRVVANVEY